MERNKILVVELKLARGYLKYIHKLLGRKEKIN
jgi:hypothetical protein